MCLACRQAEPDREPLRINDRVDFGRKPASGATETMICVCVMSAFDTKRTCQSCCSMSAFGGIVLQKSKIARALISRHKTNQPTTANLCRLNHVTEVAREFVVRR